MGLLLAIETSARIGSLALLRTGEGLGNDELLGCAALGAQRRHDEQLLRAIDALLAEHRCRASDLTAVAFGDGPGSFTGVRLAAAAAQGIGWGLGIPVLGVNSSEALAVGVARQFHVARVAVAVDARLGQVYWLSYGGSEGQGGPDTTLAGAQGAVLDAAQLEMLPPPTAEFIAAGDGWQGTIVPAAWRVRAARVIADAVPQAADVASLARIAWQSGARPTAGDAQPRYLRGADAWRTD